MPFVNLLQAFGNILEMIPASRILFLFSHVHLVMCGYKVTGKWKDGCQQNLFCFVFKVNKYRKKGARNSMI